MCGIQEELHSENWVRVCRERVEVANIGTTRVILDDMMEYTALPAPPLNLASDVILLVWGGYGQ